MTNKKPTTLGNLDKHESGLRKLQSGGADKRYRAFKSLSEARCDPRAVAILEGDDGGQIYVTAPIGLVKCSEETLLRLLRDLDSLEWCDPSMASVRYEVPTGSTVAGGMGGGIITGDVWVHPNLSRFSATIRSVLDGEITTWADLPTQDPRPSI